MPSQTLAPDHIWQAINFIGVFFAVLVMYPQTGKTLLNREIQ